MWLNSPPSTSNTITHPPQLHGISSAHSNILNGVLPLHHHHVGSAPTYNLSILDKHHVYNEDWTNRTIFQPGSLETTGFSSSSMQHPLEYISSNMITQVGRQCNVTSISSSSVGLSSHQPKYRCFHGGRNSMIPIPTVIDSIVDRTRSQKKYTSSNQTINKKRYGLDIDRIIHGEDSRTTLMIKNIPNKYTHSLADIFYYTTFSNVVSFMCNIIEHSYSSNLHHVELGLEGTLPRCFWLLLTRIIMELMILFIYQ